MSKLTSTFRMNRSVMTENCPLTSSMLLFSGRWKLSILWKLNGGQLRFTQIVKEIPSASRKMIATQLRELERDGMITRTIVPAAPVNVCYDLSEKGRSLMPVLSALLEWGRKHAGS